MTSNKYMIGNDSLLSIVHRVKPNYGVTKRRKKHYDQQTSRSIPKTPQPSTSGRRTPLHATIALGMFIFIGSAAWGFGMIFTSDKHQPSLTEKNPETDTAKKDTLATDVQYAEKIARAFLSEADIEKRLSYARNPQETRQHLSSYSEQAKTHTTDQLNMIGYREIDGKAITAYAAKFSDGTYRMLSVVQTESGAKVDWDSYARYGTASWEDLLSGASNTAEVRVFTRPGDFHIGAFRDADQWTCFLIESPDVERSIYAYAPAGSPLAKNLQDSISKNPNLRQHMILNLKSINGSGKKALFLIQDLVTIGWVK